jgi:hypothetical protein
LKSEYSLNYNCKTNRLIWLVNTGRDREIEGGDREIEGGDRGGERDKKR